MSTEPEAATIPDGLTPDELRREANRRELVAANTHPVEAPVVADPIATTPRCGHHGTPLVWCGESWGLRCGDCFPEAFDERKDPANCPTCGQSLSGSSDPTP